MASQREGRAFLNASCTEADISTARSSYSAGACKDARHKDLGKDLRSHSRCQSKLQKDITAHVDSTHWCRLRRSTAVVTGGNRARTGERHLRSRQKPAQWVIIRETCGNRLAPTRIGWIRLGKQARVPSVESTAGTKSMARGPSGHHKQDQPHKERQRQDFTRNAIVVTIMLAEACAPDSS